MKTNITVSIDSDLAREARVLAAHRGTSLSRLVAEEIESMVKRDRDYDTAKRRAIKRMRNSVARGFTKPIGRDELHER